MIKPISTRWGLATATLWVGALVQAADLEAGRAVFQACSACHSVKSDEKNIGPTLYKIVGRQAGSVEGFDYSAAMKAAHLVWTAANLDLYLKNPAALVPNNKMAYAGVSDPQDRADLIAYLETLGKKP